MTIVPHEGNRMQTIFAPLLGVQIPISLKRDGGLASIVWTCGVEVDVISRRSTQDNNITIARRSALVEVKVVLDSPRRRNVGLKMVFVPIIIHTCATHATI
jgi:hypothetical protein